MQGKVEICGVNTAKPYPERRGEGSFVCAH